MSDFNQQIIDEFRANDGRTKMFGNGLVLLHSTGAKSGEPRVSPVAFRAADGVKYIFASAGGAPNDPSWAHNLRANPKVTVETGTHTYDAVATELAGAERDRVWEATTAVMPGFADYQKKTDRLIPVFALARAA